MRRILALSLFAALSCTGYRPTRFAERPPVVEARDDQPIAPPHWHWVPEPVYISEVYLHRPLREALDLSPYPDAGDVNSFDEVVRSTWFAPKRWISVRWREDRIRVGRRAHLLRCSPTARWRSRRPVSASPTREGKNTRSWSIPSDRPEMRTGAVSVAARLAWALGYNTPPVFITKVRPTISGDRKGRRPMSQRC